MTDKQTRLTWAQIRAIHPSLPESSDGWHQHENGGGWVKDTASVAASCYVGPSCVVADHASMSGNARMSGNASMYDHASMSGNAIMCDHASMYDHASMSDHASMYDHARMFGNAMMFNYASMSDHAIMFGDASMSDHASMSGNAIMCDHASMSGNAIMFGYAMMSGNAMMFGYASMTGYANMSSGSWGVSPLYLRGWLPWEVWTDRPGYLRIGCVSRSIAEWLERLDAIIRAHSNEDAEKYRDQIEAVIGMAKRYFADNADTIRDTEDEQGWQPHTRMAD